MTWLRTLIARALLPRCPWCAGFTETAGEPCSPACPGGTADEQAHSSW